VAAAMQWYSQRCVVVQGLPAGQMRARGGGFMMPGVWWQAGLLSADGNARKHRTKETTGEEWYNRERASARACAQGRLQPACVGCNRARGLRPRGGRRKEGAAGVSQQRPATELILIL
jgi:hypothetical protein